MSFLFPRTISILRDVQQIGGSDIGAQPYSAAMESTEITIVSGVPASIQSTRERGKPLGGTPSDATVRSLWNIYIPQGAVAVGVIRDRDVAADDLGRRFSLVAVEPAPLGYRIRAELLEG